MPLQPGTGEIESGGEPHHRIAWHAFPRGNCSSRGATSSTGVTFNHFTVLVVVVYCSPKKQKKGYGITVLVAQSESRDRAMSDAPKNL